MGQTTIVGKVLSESNAPVAYASVYLKNSTDASTADSMGVFALTTSLKGEQLLIVTAIGFKELDHPLVIGEVKDTLQLKLKSEARQLGEVVITAGTIEATDDRVLTLVRPTDVLSNASSTGDIVGAFQNFPGVQRNGGDQSGLFVRGGDATETMMVLDGTTVQNPFFSSVPGIGQRSRFNPFQIKGMAFSTGGYSARYGQALSSVLDLKTTDLPEKTTFSVGANVAGLFLAGSQKMDNNSLEYTGSYTDFGPYYSLSKTNYDFYSKPRSTNLSARWVSKTSDDGLFKTTVNYNLSSSGTRVPDPNDPASLIRYDLHNNYFLLNTSYKKPLTKSLQLYTAMSYSDNQDNILWGDTIFNRSDNRVQARAELTWHPASRFRLTTGGEVQHYSYMQQFDTLHNAFTETLTAGYGEVEYKPAGWFAIKPGVRAEYSDILGRGNIVPRLALAIRTGQYSQIGLASGVFYQTAPTQYLLLGYRPSFQQAVHYLANFEWIKANRSFRLEGYYKNYSQLVRDNGVTYIPNPYSYNLGMVNNSGHGYAKGFDLFWRDKASIPNIDYWITYSYIDTKRLYQNYLAEAQPDFVSTHNLNVIVKYLSEPLHTFMSAAWNYSSGRPYYNPQAKSFLVDRAPGYQNLSFKVSYLTNIKKMFTAIYVNFDNLTNYKNILGYRYSNDGQLRSPVLPPQYFSVFFGVYLSFTPFKKDDL
ncbi:TonB-dependent receptor [Puia dinghuensis]|uniref:TonB-dependent receptor n=1 Tax=Puia dinghuensis TaxID=1792502 RepID=A0A8J2XUI1_9BACT|nr:carboxypeptidase-like regulatory domain-containing protein [Puia dinghuensis]GGB12794.1 TonB-dependent receptor [Puia dinghuensis]